jgi:hypothetical protein
MARTRRETRPGGPRGAAPTRLERPGGPPARHTPPAAVVARYEPLAEFPAAGAEADLMLVRDRASGEQVVFKWYRLGLKPDPLAMALLRAADPRHVVRLVDFHDAADGAWELQEYCPLGSLGDWVAAQGGRLPPPTLALALAEMAAALHYLHSLGAGIAHRDLKPANVLVRAAQPLDLVLADFGLARAQQGMSRLTTTLKGTWHYTAPEVYKQISSPKSDWFSLGAIIYELHTGRRLFAMEDGSEIDDADARARCESGAYSTAAVADPRWRLLCDGLLAYQRQERWGYEQVEAWLGGASPPAPAQTGPPGPAPGQPPGPGYQPGWASAPVRSGPELAEQLRVHWREAADGLAGRPEAGLVRFVAGLPAGPEALEVLDSAEGVAAKLVRLQGLLDPGGPLVFDGAALDPESVGRRVQAAARGRAEALDWLEAVLAQGVLTAFAEVAPSPQMARAAYWLGRWHDQAVAALAPLAPELAEIGRAAWRESLPELFGEALRRAGREAA